MTVLNLSPGGYAANCYLLTAGAAAVLIDATVSPARLQRALTESGSHLLAVLLTHGHFDHLLTAKELGAAFGVPFFLHTADAELPCDGEKNASAVFLGEELTFPPADRNLSGGETLTFGDISLRVLHTPGHTGGSVTYLCGDAAFTGDTLFAQGFGRTDLFGGDLAALRQSLNGLSALPPETRIYPGHGEDALLSDALA